MTIEIIGDADPDKLYCTGSLTKMMTTFVCLSLLAENHDLNAIVDDEGFLDIICNNEESKNFLRIFQKHIGGRFTLRDLCTHYTGLPYTFDLSDDELDEVEHGKPFKHHGIIEEDIFLMMCRDRISQIYVDRCKFHYSELSIIFLGYLIEKVFDTSMEFLYQKYVIGKFQLQDSLFSRTLPANAFVEDLSDRYDYPSISIQNHGYFCYSNGFYTTLNDHKIIIECLLNEPVFQFMTDVTHARAASHRLMNGMSVEIRQVNNDILFGYEGLSFSGCNIWAYSIVQQKGYITLSNDEDAVYDVIYGKFGYHEFDAVPNYTEDDYHYFITHYHDITEDKPIPDEYVGSYHRVTINSTILTIVFTVGSNFIVIRNPEEIRYDVVCIHGKYYVRGKDHIHGSRVSLYRGKSGNHYMMYDGTMYRKI